MNRNRRFWIAFVAISIIALVSTWFVFETRYVWFVNEEEFTFLRYGLLLGMAIIAVLWSVHPSRVLIGLIGVGVFSFPPLLRGEKFAAIDSAFLIWVFVVVLLLIGATELNRRARGRRDGTEAFR